MIFGRRPRPSETPSAGPVTPFIPGQEQLSSETLIMLARLEGLADRLEIAVRRVEESTRDQKG